MRDNIGRCNIQVALQDIQRKLLHGINLYRVIGREGEGPVPVIGSKIDDFYTNGSVIKIVAVAPDTDTGMLCPFLFIHQIEDTHILETGINVGFLGWIRNQIMRIDTAIAGKSCYR